LNSMNDALERRYKIAAAAAAEAIASGKLDEGSNDKNADKLQADIEELKAENAFLQRRFEMAAAVAGKAAATEKNLNGSSNEKERMILRKEIQKLKEEMEAHEMAAAAEAESWKLSEASNDTERIRLQKEIEKLKAEKDVQQQRYEVAIAANITGAARGQMDAKTSATAKADKWQMIDDNSVLQTWKHELSKQFTSADINSTADRDVDSMCELLCHPQIQQQGTCKITDEIKSKELNKKAAENIAPANVQRGKPKTCCGCCSKRARKSSDRACLSQVETVVEKE